ncbi:HAD family phosphatase [Emergencia sp. 1XD21-10]|uniref:HAD family hydrolase n=1 Tax=Emergencia sp. 1XD21-10 TaxID=2304569 RepID=UPI001379CE29|nr:HAD family phosphatase [Emergencia sp. 1XD21-10]NCE97988.1 HAD family phosphatase [Emergencia sp. 1XD21-10]
MIKGFVFDMDGLLFDSERIVQRSWNAAGSELGYEGIGEQIYNTLGFNRARRAVYFKEIYGDDFPVEAFQERAARHFVQIVDLEGMSMKEGAREVLKFAKEKGIAVGLATSSSEGYARGNLQRAGIESYFDGLISGNMVGRSKPDPEIYLKACAAIGVAPAEAIAFEDAAAGILSASKAGLRTVMVPDLVQPAEEILEKVWMLKPSLTEALEELKKIL